MHAPGFLLLQPMCSILPTMTFYRSTTRHSSSTHLQRSSLKALCSGLAILKKVQVFILVSAKSTIDAGP